MDTLPRGLKAWFITHFAVDMIFAFPMMIAPTLVMGLFGFEATDPLTTRLVGAALFGIGGISFIERNERPDVFRSLLTLKLIWSAMAVVAIVWTMIEGGPPALWLFLAIFVAFFVVWLRYRLLLKKV